VLGLLATVTAVIVALGVTFAPLLVNLLAPGFEAEKQELTVRLVRILFPGTGLLVLSAWCLGVLNSHRQFLLSYAAPVAWNAAIILATLLAGQASTDRTAVWSAWGAVAGALLQFGIQLPSALRLLGGVRPSLDSAAEGIRTTLRTFLPALASRGVVQVSAFVDGIIGSLLPSGAVAALLNAQLLYTLPVSLFGVSVAAAELPALSEAAGAEATHGALRERLQRGLARITFYVVPSAVVLLFLGEVTAAAVFQTGRFTSADVRYVAFILMGAAPGLLASTRARLVASGWYALHDTTHPFRYAVLRVLLGTMAGYLAARHGPALLGVEARWGAVGLTLAASLAGWLEYALLRRSLERRIGRLASRPAEEAILLAAALAATAVAWAVLTAIGGWPGPVLRAGLVLGAFGVSYLGLTWILRVPEARELVARVASGP
jgi:putative peptidoglycan lipid II flippase